MTGEAFGSWNTAAKRGYAAKACSPGVSACLNIPAIQAMRHWAALKADIRRERSDGMRFGNIECGARLLIYAGGDLNCVEI